MHQTKIIFRHRTWQGQISGPRAAGDPVQALFAAHRASVHRLDQALHLFHDKRHPETLGADEVWEFLSHLASEGRWPLPNRTKPFSALLFLCREVLKQELPWIDNIERAKRLAKLPVVFTPEEAHAVLTTMHGTARLMAHLLYGSGLRLIECVRLREGTSILAISR